MNRKWPLTALHDWSRQFFNMQVEESVVPDEEESKEKEVSEVWEERWVGERGWSVGGGWEGR